MRSRYLLSLFLLLATDVHANKGARHVDVVHRRQASSTSSLPSPTAPSNKKTAVGAPPDSTNVPSGTSSAPMVGTSIPPLANITFGMPVMSSLPVSSAYTAGASPPVSGAPALPTPFVFSMSEWPPQDQVPDIDSNEVGEWMLELRGFNIPDIPPTVDGTCANDAAAAANASNTGWWTCGGYTRDTDITLCPQKYTWGVSFDDGPSPYSQELLNFLGQHDILATFFVVGSRVIERPTVLVEEYMSGHEISVHTWSHKPLTSLTNEQIVAELGWTRKAIRAVLGVTPTTMRPPFGDIDDRVRAICLAMGLVPIMWTRAPGGGQFDTNDWRVASGQVDGEDSFNSFESILANATLIDTGFIVLEHDLYQQAVDLAVGYTLNAALTHNPPLTLQPIGKCNNIPESNLYFESNKNTTFPYRNQTSGGYDIDGEGTINILNGGGTTPTSAGSQNLIPVTSMMLLLGIVALLN